MTPLWAEALALRAATPDPTEIPPLWQKALAHEAIDKHDNETDFIHFLTANNCFNRPRLLDDPKREPTTGRWLAHLDRADMEESPYCTPEAVFDLNGKRTSTLLLMQQYYAQRIDSVAPTTILEIGAGYGGLARVLQLKAPRHYVIVDLVDSLFCSYVYLKANFPDAVFEWDGVGADFNFIPAHHTSKLPGGRCDMAINTCSLGEMLPEQREMYLSLIGQTCEHFYSHNRIDPPIDPPANWQLLFDETEGAAQAEPETPPSREFLAQARPAQSAAAD